MISAVYPDLCVVYCVPDGECEGKVQTGQLNYLGITGEGNCIRKGYTESAELSSFLDTSKYIKSLMAPCKGMTRSGFRKPNSQMPDTEVCGKGQVAYERFAHKYKERSTCKLFCVPEGECQVKANAGKLGKFGIKQQGNCRSTGYTDPVEFDKMDKQMDTWIKNLTGPCKG